MTGPERESEAVIDAAAQHYERYKDALRRGHVAAVHGRLATALAAYADAAELAPERALPLASLAGILVRMGRPAEALTHYDRALALAPGDETSIDGRARVLVALGRPAEAAVTLDRLVDVFDRSGRLADACDAARRALELAESRDRRRVLEDLAGRLRAEPPDDGASEALERALRSLEPVVVAQPAGERAGGVGEGLALEADAEALLAAGDRPAAVERFLAAADAHRRAGIVDAALDACHQALAIGPADARIHLALAELWLDVGWRELAGEKAVLLRRFAGLVGDTATIEQLARLAAERLPDDPRLAAPAG